MKKNSISLKKNRCKSTDAILRILHDYKDILKNRYKTKEIGLFGSYVKSEQKKHSDIDILVEFTIGHKTFDNYMELKFFLEAILHRKIDLIIKTAVRKELKDTILNETIYV